MLMRKYLFKYDDSIYKRLDDQERRLCDQERRIRALEAKANVEIVESGRCEPPKRTTKRGCPVNPYLPTDVDNVDIIKRVRAFVMRCMEGKELKTRVNVEGHRVPMTRCLVCLHYWLVYHGVTTVEDNNVAAYLRFLSEICPEIGFPSIQSFNREAKFLHLPKEISKMLPADLKHSEMTAKELEVIQIVYQYIHAFFA